MPKFANKFYFDELIIPDLFDVESEIMINGKEIKNNKLANPLRQVFNTSLESHLCPYCKINIFLLKKDLSFDNHPTKTGASLRIWDCPMCSFWKIFIDNLDYDSGETSDILFSSKIREFNHQLPQFFKEEIAIHLKREPNLWHNFNPRLFEKYVAELFKANFDYTEVLHVGGPNDLGIDVFYIDSKKEEWLIQVKRRSRSNSKETISTVIHLLGSMTIKDSKKGIIVSTADRYTSNAVKLVGNMRNKDYFIELIDVGILNRMIDKLIPKTLPLLFLESGHFGITYFGQEFSKDLSQIKRELKQIYCR